MTALNTVDPRVIAEALQMDTYDLAAQLVTWAKESLPSPYFESRDARGPMSLELFDERVAQARRHLEAAHAAFAAFNEDNSADDE